ncbi:predicted protein [Postia placenta Mad-698-R]|uniref:Uncharacterized protein n=1 Tax=Postia placenta MAD-698-R-SB12 TaxID=670580 RepID=A0A1X6MR59_9APHY|nr:hypothetical protein POSPLADRAFT_1151482 [Postia placenta MAD-698-R-SB12]EED85948.1 predicted protein [Postia placenta Mad-698-R]OSX58867.1 hypothetical protein POSPLADRAFT_1151482 [Postia placenta MAD-698-R-SB12]
MEFQGAIPRTVHWTLEQCREFCGGAFLTHGLVTAELGDLDLCCCGVVEIAKTALERHEEILDVGKGRHSPLYSDLNSCELGKDWGGPAAGGMEDGPGVEAVVVAVRQVDFGGNKCVSSLTAAMMVEALEETRWEGDVHQRLEPRRGPRTTSWPN